MEALRAAGMEVSRISDRLTVTETEGASSLLAGIRNRGGEALGAYLQGPEAAGIKALDLRASGIYDNGVAHICMSSRLVDRIEELRVGTLGQYGLEYLLMAARRSSNLKILELQVKDVPTLHMDRQTLAPEDFDIADYGDAAENAEEEGGGGGEGEEGGESAADRKARIAKIMQENDYDSDEEREKELERKRAAREKRGHRGKKEAEEEEGAGEEEEAQKKETGPSPALLALLNELVDVAQEKTQLREITVGGDCPASVMYELRRVVEQHAEKRSGMGQESDRVASHSAAAALTAQMEELSKELEASSGPDPGARSGAAKKSGGLIADLDELAMDDMDRTSLDLRMYVNRRLFAVLGEALFECQRQKSKDNDAVSKPGGEMAFLASYIRQAQQRLAPTSAS